MNPNGAVIKLGGSVLTDKSSPELRLDGALLSDLAHELRELEAYPLILVHGAGSFGHRIVHQTGIHHGLSGRESRLAMGETQRLQYVLSTQVTARLLEAGLPAIPVQASASAIMTGGRLERMDLSAVELLVQKGLVPVLYGVPAVDRESGCSILSGDVIAAYLAENLEIPLLVHATQTDGVFEADPHQDPAARRIARIGRQNWAEVRSMLTGSAEVDVTGGMAGKVEALLGLARAGLTSRIVSARIPGRISAAVRGEDVGTLISWEDA